jgi:lipopolysaccharide biosynthesis glycosyltransferase
MFLFISLSLPTIMKTKEGNLTMDLHTDVFDQMKEESDKSLLTNNSHIHVKISSRKDRTESQSSSNKTFVVVTSKKKTWIGQGINNSSQSTETSKKIRSHVCRNKDFYPNHRSAIFTLLIPGKHEYMTAAKVLGISLQHHAPFADRIIMELEPTRKKPATRLSRNEWASLQRAGWTHKCTIQPIQPTIPASSRFEDQFAKLRIWGMTVYDIAIYMDADTLVVGNIHDLFKMKLSGEYKIGVTADYRIDYGISGSGGAWATSFNMGVFIIHPSKLEYNRLLKMQEEGAIQDYEHIMAEQGWLNAVYKNQWKEIGYIYNANIAAKDHDKRFAENTTSIRIIHYTTMKPWYDSPGSNSYEQWSHPWVKFRDKLLQRNGCINDDYVPPNDNHRIALATFLTDTVEISHTTTDRKKERADYTYGAAALIKSIDEYVGTSKFHGTFNTILLEIPSRRLPESDREWLKSLGWNFCTVSPIDAPNKPFGRFIDQFNKLHLWNFVEYDKVIYLDSDVLITDNIDRLLDRNLTKGNLIGVTRDYFGTKFVHGFNMGVFLIHPKVEEYLRLRKLLDDDSVKYDTAQAEQGFLNSVYKKQWEEIGIEYNANMAVWAMKRDSWPEKPRIKHYTLEKPWQEDVPKYRSQSLEPLDIFLQTWKVAAKKYGVWPYDW